MKALIPENSTISSNRWRMSALGIPMMAPCRYRFSRPVRSWWNPAAISSSAPTRPRTSARPSVGGMIFVNVLRMVDLPAPFRPMMPSTSPGRTWKLTSWRAQNWFAASSCRRVALPMSRRAVAGIRSRRLSWRSPRRNFFQTFSKSTPGSRDGRSDIFGKGGLGAVEEEARRQQADDGPRRAVEQHPGIPRHRERAGARRLAERQQQVVSLDDAQAKALEDRGQRVELHVDGALRAHHRRLVEDRREEDAEGEQHL